MAKVLNEGKPQQGGPIGEGSPQPRTGQAHRGSLHLRSASAQVADEYRRIGRRIALTDGATVLVAFVTSYFLRYPVHDLRPDYLSLTLLAPLVWIGIFHAHRLYAPEHLSAWEEFRRLLSSTGLGMAFLVMASYWTKGDLSRLWLGLGWFFAVTVLLLGRRAWRVRLAKYRASGRLAYPTLLIGSNGEARHLAETLQPEHGFAFIGRLTTDSADRASFDGLPLLGTLDDFAEALDESGAECIFVASSAVTADRMSHIIRVARMRAVEIRLSANVPEILSTRLTVQPYGNVMALSLRSVRLTAGQIALKRTFDVVAAGLGALILLPIFLVVATAVRMTSRGPALFRQERVTKHGRTFSMYKFRTMAADADQRLEELHLDPSAPFFKLRDDPRLTKVGRLLRRFSLDELPQLMNVLKGEMSLVGPRPLPAAQVAANLDLLESRHEVLAGMTGWWQIQGRSNVDPQESVRLDRFYIENWSLGLDLYVVLKTIGTVLSRKGAY